MQSVTKNIISRMMYYITAPKTKFFCNKIITNLWQKQRQKCFINMEFKIVFACFKFEHHSPRQIQFNFWYHFWWFTKNQTQSFMFVEQYHLPKKFYQTQYNLFTRHTDIYASITTYKKPGTFSTETYIIW